MTRKPSCNEELLTLYLYQELATVESRSLEEHLIECARCRAALEELRSCLAALATPGLTLSFEQKQQFSAQVTARISQPRRGGLIRWGSALAVSTVLGLMVLMLQPVNRPVAPAASAAALAELEVLEQFELLQELDLLQDLELLQELG